jgi:hypothetical protein
VHLFSIKINVWNLQPTNFSYTEPGRVNQGQQYALLQPLGRLEQTAGFFLRKHNGEVAFVLHAGQANGPVIQIVNPIEEPEAIDGMFEESLAQITIRLHGVEVAIDFIGLQIERWLFAVQTDLGNASGIAKNRTGRITFDGDLFFKLSDMTGKTGRFTLGAFQ